MPPRSAHSALSLVGMVYRISWTSTARSRFFHAWSAVSAGRSSR